MALRGSRDAPPPRQALRRAAAAGSAARKSSVALCGRSADRVRTGSADRAALRLDSRARWRALSANDVSVMAAGGNPVLLAMMATTAAGGNDLLVTPSSRNEPTTKKIDGAGLRGASGGGLSTAWGARKTQGRSAQLKHTCGANCEEVLAWRRLRARGALGDAGAVTQASRKPIGGDRAASRLEGIEPRLTGGNGRRGQAAAERRGDENGGAG